MPALGEAKTPVLSKEKQWGKLTQSSGVVRREDSRIEKLCKAKPVGARKSGPAYSRRQEHAGLGGGAERGEGVRNAGKKWARVRRKREASGKEAETSGVRGMPGEVP